MSKSLRLRFMTFKKLAKKKKKKKICKFGIKFNILLNQLQIEKTAFFIIQVVIVAYGNRNAQTIAYSENAAGAPCNAANIAK